MAYLSKIFGAVCLATLIGLAVYSYWAAQPAQYVSITFLDVGQGDAIYIRTQSGSDILIDGGPDDQVVRRLGEVMPFWDRTLELVILTHPDADHITGLVPVFDYYTIKQLALVDLPVQSAVHQAFHDRLTIYQPELIYPVAGDTISLGDHEQLHVLHPFASDKLSTAEVNDTSIIIEYEFNGDQETTQVLLTGDISKAVEEKLVAHNSLRDIDILKVPHHGSKSSSSADFLNAIQAEYFVIQVGADNRYDHPHQEVLDRLEQRGIVLRNDQLGNITMHINAQGYGFLPF